MNQILKMKSLSSVVLPRIPSYTAVSQPENSSFIRNSEWMIERESDTDAKEGAQPKPV
jgi:hypothetical protein